MPDPSRDGLPLLTMGGAPLLTTGGVPLLLAATQLCTMTEMPVESPYGVRWQVQLSLAIMPV
ncbi:hypothetical protein [Methylobrevis pamukkalensis]|uniref:Uncharacterized protein n=1 Tax=Methylobrevis pamukkalensis TaxID=1439726 RepID=A0A1E3GX73_9HYPH|nr:hypothetical protein [Methylobrevis pamukkalensis]ODN68545.1 hypothetical protein A6302_04158 [Methylobrevis pamukkalensis]